MYDKKDLREKNREIRARLVESGAIVGISKSIVEKIKQADYFLSAQHILIFHPKRGEINLLKLLKSDWKQFYLPRCKGNRLEICPYCVGDELCENNYGIFEPICAPLHDLSILDVVFIPALGADLEGGRIGYGGGFYDRFLASGTREGLRAKKVVAIPRELVCKKINCEAHDVKYDELVTD